MAGGGEAHLINVVIDGKDTRSLQEVLKTRPPTVVLTQAEYDALVTKDPITLYAVMADADVAAYRAALAKQS